MDVEETANEGITEDDYRTNHLRNVAIRGFNTATPFRAFEDVFGELLRKGAIVEDIS